MPWIKVRMRPWEIVASFLLVLVLSLLLKGALNRPQERELIRRAQHACHAFAEGLRIYRLTHGHLPEDLQTLVDDKIANEKTGMRLNGDKEIQIDYLDTASGNSPNATQEQIILVCRANVDVLALFVISSSNTVYRLGYPKSKDVGSQPLLGRPIDEARAIYQVQELARVGWE